MVEGERFLPRCHGGRQTGLGCCRQWWLAGCRCWRVSWDLPLLGSMHVPTMAASFQVAEDGGKTNLGVFVGCSHAAAGMEGGTDRAGPADPSLSLWEDEMEMWLAAGGRLPAGPGGFAMGNWREDRGEEEAVRGGGPWALPPLLCWELAGTPTC